MLDLDFSHLENHARAKPNHFAAMDIPGFDPSTMTYLASQLVHPNVNGHQDPFQDMLLPMDMHHHSQYGGDTYTHAGSDDLALHGLPPQAPPLKRTYSAYEDPFSDVVSAFDNPIIQDNAEPDAPSIDRDNKLLSFSIPSFDYTLLNYNFQRTTLSLTAQLHGMFFLAESPWATAGDAQAPPTELTCYRRNLFQITGEVTIPRTLRYILTEHGEQLGIIGQELVISSTESTEGNSVKIISVPWKTPANPTGPTTDDKVEREPPSIPLDLMNVSDADGELATFPFQWKRLQFRIATANNGRRKELQQHFLVQLKVVATLTTGAKISIGQVQSGAIIVRGRSPRNFQSRKDMPLNGSSHNRKSVPGQAARSTTGDSVKRINDNSSVNGAGGVTTTKAEPTSAPRPPPQFNDANEAQLASEYNDWKAPNGKRLSNATNLQLLNSTSPPDIANLLPSPDRSRAVKPFTAPSAPINLSLVEEESPHSLTNNLHESPDSRMAKKVAMPPRPPSFTLHNVNSPDESADLLYEYFPLGLDDWMPPVDAVYRPHVVHHTKLIPDPRDPKTSGRSSRSKRYFSEDVT